MPAVVLPKQFGNILLENEDVVAVNKVAGILSVPDRTQSEPSLKDALLQLYGQIFTVHRLDRETSGLILFAKNAAAHARLSQLFEDRSMEKYYLGLVHGIPALASGTIDGPIMEHPAIKGQMVVNRKGKPSVTDYELLKSYNRYSLVKFRIHTGRTHQVRVHAKHIGHPIVCDALYGDGQPVMLSAIKKKFKLSKQQLEERPILNRTALHAWELLFNDNGQAYHLTAPIPKDLTALLTQLEKNS
jgi:23S rRNA pseudouridine955/2504/2580 synthase/23S rRNA pseudouridine1911/1915/1917 synthase